MRSRFVFAVLAVAGALVVGLASPVAALPPPAGATVVGAASASCPSPAFATIQAAVDAADPGDTIFVCAGTYGEAVLLTEGITLLGARWGEDARGRTGAETVIDAGGAPAAIASLNGSALTVDGFTLTGALRAAGATGGVSAHRLENNIVEGNTEGFQFSGGTGGAQTVIRHNLFTGNNGPSSGGAVSGTGVVFNTAAASNVLIAENAFTDNPGSPAGGDAADVNVIQGGSDIVIRDNTSTGGGSFAVLNGTPGTLVTGNSITDGAASTFVLFDGTSGTTISDNTVSGGPTGSTVRDLSTTGGFIVTDNTISGRGFGIRLQSPGSTVTGNTVSGSTTLDCEDTSTGDGTAGTANTWTDNVGDTATPAGICAPAPPVPPTTPTTTDTPATDTPTTDTPAGGDPGTDGVAGGSTIPATGSGVGRLAATGFAAIGLGAGLLRWRRRVDG
jgi:parallel beta-helix repeat protein